MSLVTHARRRAAIAFTQDVTLAVVALVTSGVIVANGGFGVTRVDEDAPSVLAWALVTVSATVLVARRRHPVSVYTLSSAATALLAIAYTPIGVPVGPGVALYTLAAGRSATLPTARVLWVGAAGFGAYLVASGVDLRQFPWYESFHGAVLLAAFWLAGERSRLQREKIDELKREAARDRLLAAADERARIARDLHDSVGHAINVIGVRAGAARLRHAKEPDRTIDALTMIEDLARTTVAEIDNLVGALRTRVDDPDVLPHSLAAVATLVDQHRQCGFDVTVQMRGEPPTLSPTAEQAAFRIVQEGLTNASRHGAGEITVEIDAHGPQLTIEIRNPVSPTTGETRYGHGLAGAHERTELLGGALNAGVHAGQFVLRAELPYSLAEARQ